MDDGATPIAIRLRRSIPDHDAYTVRLADHRFAVLATARASDARRWVATTRWLYRLLLFHGRLIVGLGVQWTPPWRPLGGAPPVPSTLKLCVGHRCLVFHLAQANGVPDGLYRFLADPRVTFVGSGSAHDCRMLWAHYGIHVARGLELRAVAGMGNTSVEEMAGRITDDDDEEDDEYEDDEEDEDDGSDMTDLDVYEDDEDEVCSGLGTLSGDDLEEDEYAETGILTGEDSNRDDELNGDEEDGAGNAFEHLGDSEAVLDDGEDLLGQDDWNDQEDYGCDDPDDDVSDEIYYL